MREFAEGVYGRQRGDPQAAARARADVVKSLARRCGSSSARRCCANGGSSSSSRPLDATSTSGRRWRAVPTSPTARSFPRLRVRAEA